MKAHFVSGLKIQETVLNIDLQVQFLLQGSTAEKLGGDQPSPGGDTLTWEEMWTIDWAQSFQAKQVYDSIWENN